MKRKGREGVRNGTSKNVYGRFKAQAIKLAGS